jgi:hypothetical protein
MVLIVVGIIAAALLWSPPDIERYVPTDATGSSPDISVTVTEVAYLTDNNYRYTDLEIESPPNSGKQYALVTAKITNDRGTHMNTYRILWGLQLDDGTLTYQEIYGHNSLPSRLYAEETATFCMLFEIDADARVVGVKCNYPGGDIEISL